MQVRCSAEEVYVSYGYQETVHATRKPALSSLPPHHTLLQAFVMSLKEACVAKQEVFKFARCSVAVFKSDKPAIHTNKETADAQ
jgi:hypothetical protein